MKVGKTNWSVFAPALVLMRQTLYLCQQLAATLRMSAGPYELRLIYSEFLLTNFVQTYCSNKSRVTGFGRQRQGRLRTD